MLMKKFNFMLSMVIYQQFATQLDHPLKPMYIIHQQHVRPLLFLHYLYAKWHCWVVIISYSLLITPVTHSFRCVHGSLLFFLVDVRFELHKYTHTFICLFIGVCKRACCFSPLNTFLHRALVALPRQLNQVCSLPAMCHEQVCKHLQSLYIFAVNGKVPLLLAKPFN